MNTTRRAGLAVALLFIVSLPAVTPRIYASDEIQYFSYLRSLWFDGDVSFENEYRHFYDAGLARSPDFHETFLVRTTPTGLRENFGTIGCAILWAPFFGLADLAVRGFGLGEAEGEGGFSRPYIAAVSYASALYGLLALLLSLYAARRILADEREGSSAQQHDGSGAALAGVLAAWAGTPLLFYMYVAPPMSHATSAFAVAAFVVCWLAVRQAWSPRGAALLGARGALMTMVREQDAFFVAGPILDFVLSAVSRRAHGSRSPGTNQRGAGTYQVPALFATACSGAAAFAICFIPQALAYVALNGRIGPSHVVSRKMAWTAPYAAGVLFSPQHGFLVWTPLALFAIAGLLLLLRRRPASGASPASGAGGNERDADRLRLGLGLLAMVALQVYIAGSVRSWTVAGAFGHRRFVGLTVVLVMGLALLFSRVRARPARVALAATIAVCVWWNVALMAQFGSGLMDRQRLEPGRNAYHAFVTIPRELPKLAWRYLFARDSFYRWGKQGP